MKTLVLSRVATAILAGICLNAPLGFSDDGSTKEAKKNLFEKVLHVVTENAMKVWKVVTAPEVVTIKIPLSSEEIKKQNALRDQLTVVSLQIMGHKLQSDPDFAQELREEHGPDFVNLVKKSKTQGRFSSENVIKQLDGLEEGFREIGKVMSREARRIDRGVYYADDVLVSQELSQIKWLRYTLDKLEGEK